MPNCFLSPSQTTPVRVVPGVAEHMKRHLADARARASRLSATTLSVFSSLSTSGQALAWETPVADVSCMTLVAGVWIVAGLGPTLSVWHVGSPVEHSRAVVHTAPFTQLHALGATAVFVGLDSDLRVNAWECSDSFGVPV